MGIRSTLLMALLVGSGLWVLSSAPAEAGLEDLFRKGTGTDKTKTTDGDAEMDLPEYQGIKHAVGVVDFNNDSGWRGEASLGQNLTIMLESALMDTGRFVLVERDKLGYVLDEQDLAASGRAAKAKDVAQTGKLRPAKYIATGTVVEVDHNESGVDSGLRIKGFKIGGGKSDAKLTIIAKIIETSTGQIVAKKRIEGEAGRAKINVGYYEGGIGGDIGAFAKTPLGEAAQDCINQAAEYFGTQFEEIPADGSVVLVKDGRVIINRGAQYNFREGTILEMREEGEDLIDPDTGEILEKAEGRTIGKIKITKASDKVSYCEVIEGETNPARGTDVLVLSSPKPDPAQANADAESKKD